jgi:hypothetical protein
VCFSHPSSPGTEYKEIPILRVMQVGLAPESECPLILCAGGEEGGRGSLVMKNIDKRAIIVMIHVM